MIKQSLFIIVILIAADAVFSESKAMWYSQLKSDDPQQTIKTDIDNDGDIDIIERWWNGKRARWFDENDDMRSSDEFGDVVDDSVQIDLDGDGIYDGTCDMSIDWADNDKDGRADLQIIAINPNGTQKQLWGGSSHYMIFVDTDKDGVLGYIDWQKFDLACWRYTGGCNFSPDYNGDSIFLKIHVPPYALNDARLNWENPFAFFDVDKDGCTEMAVRLVDMAVQKGNIYEFTGKIGEAYITYDIDNDSQRGNEFDFDMSLKFFNGSFDYRHMKNKYPAMKAPQWVLPYFQHTNWRVIDELIYVPHDKCYDAAWQNCWGSCYFTFDEDDDDHRWERVELYLPGNPYSFCRSMWNRTSECNSICRHVQSDSLGDRGEWDTDNSGKGRFYIGNWDKKLHLHGAEAGAWSVDSKAQYWGGTPIGTPAASSAKQASAADEIVLYKDTDNDGYFDEISYDYNGDEKTDLKISLAELEISDLLKKGELFDPAQLKWEGLHSVFCKIANDSWQDALMLYRAVWKRGLATQELENLAVASSVWEKYHNGYWLKEKIFRMLDGRLEGEQKRHLHKAYFSGDISSLCQQIAEL